MISKILSGAFCLALFFLSTCVISQQTIELKSGFVGGSGGGAFLEDLNDDAFIFMYGESSNGTDYSKVPFVVINKNTLQVTDTLFSWKQNELGHSYKIVKYATSNSGNRYLADLYYPNNDTDAVLNIYSIGDSLKISRLINSIPFQSRYLLGLGFSNDEFIVCTQKHSQFSLESYIDVVDTLGNVKASRTFFDLNDTSGLMVNPLSYWLEPKPMPNDSNAFILSESNFHPIICILDQNTLEVKKTYDPDNYGINGANNLLFNHQISTINAFEMEVQSDGIIMSGHAFTHPFWISNNDLSTRDQQGVWLKQYWDGSFDVKLFGEIDVNDMVYHHGQNKKSGIHVVSGATNYDIQKPPISDEDRDVFVVVFDDYGTYDTIWLFGYSNHYPYYTKVEENGDVFVTGAYSDYRNSDSVYTWITKIPGIAVGLIEQEKITNRLFVFPNPTVNQISIEEPQKFINGQYVVYSQTGVEVLHGRFEQNSIEVEHLPPGVYILNITSLNGIKFSALFVKE